MHESAFIVIRDSDGRTQRQPFAAERMIVGRTSDAAVRIDHALVSRQHAELWRDVSGRFHVRDLNSRNGTFIKGQRITDHALVGSEQISIGNFTLTIEAPADTAPPATASRPLTRVVLAGNDPGRLTTLKDHQPPRIEVSHLMTLNEFSQTVLNTPRIADRFAAMCQLMVGPQFRAQWAVVVRMAIDAANEWPEVLSDAQGPAASKEPHLSRTVLRHVCETGEAVLASNMGLPASQEINVEVSISPNIVAMAAIACPVARGANTLDILYVMLPPILGSAEWLALVNLAVKHFQQAESAWAARRQAEAIAGMERELERARQIQMRLVPTNPRFEGLDLAIGFVPCLWVGGDYVDAVRMTDGRILLTVADVCGKGLAAALVSSSLHTMVHASVLGGLGLYQLMSNLNLYLCRRLAEDSFVTMIAVAIDPTSGELEMVNAGHPAPMVLAPDSEARLLDVEHSFPLGLQEAEIILGRHQLAQGELLALYSDGLTELRTNESEMLEIAGLAAELKAAYPSRHTSSQHVADRLSQRMAILQNTGPSTDDRTFLLAQRA